MSLPVPSSGSADELPPETSFGVSWRRYGVALLPLALAGLLPWWATVLLCGLFALGVRSQEWFEGRLLLSLLVGGVSILPGLSALLSGGAAQALVSPLTWHYVLILLGLVGLHWAAVLLEGGLRRGLGVLALLGLLAPQPLLLLALAGGALCRESPDDREVKSGVLSPLEAGSRRLFLGWLVGGVALLVLLAVVLPRYQLVIPTETVRSGTVPPLSDMTVRPPESAPVPPAPTGGAGPFGLNWTQGVRVPVPPLEVGLVAMLVLSLALLWKLLQFSVPAERKKRQWLHLLMIGGLLLNGFLLVLLAMAQGGEAGGAALPPGASGSGAATQANQAFRQILNVPMDILNTLGWFILVGQVLLAVLGVWFLLRLRAVQEKQPESETALNALPVEEAGIPYHRVRVAYRRAEEALRNQGWGRGATETPQAYAGRLGGQQVLFAGPLAVLTALYSPVRYGGVVSEQEAEQAEQAAGELVVLAAAHPFHEERGALGASLEGEA